VSIVGQRVDLGHASTERVADGLIFSPVAASNADATAKKMAAR
jgi:hypothetical protein